MNSDNKLSEKIELDLTRALKFMNHYHLTEFEYQDKETNEAIEIVRSSKDNSPPLLEGRTRENKNIIYAPAVGQIDWKVENGEAVETEEVVAVIHKHREDVKVKTSTGGIIRDCLSAEPVEFGEKLATVESTGDEQDEQ